MPVITSPDYQEPGIPYKKLSHLGTYYQLGVENLSIFVDNEIATQSVIGGALNSTQDHIEWDC